MTKWFWHRAFVVGVILLITVGGLLVGCSGSENTPDITSEITNTPTPPPATAEEPATYLAIMHTSIGDITLELYREKVTVTVDNFVRLAREGFYDGLTFHRIKDDFMIQGGQKTLDGTEKTSPYGPIKLETHPEVLHVDGAISMARTNDPNSATNQFFICDGAQSFLNTGYAAFGVVVEGIDVVRAIASAPHGGEFEPSPGGGIPTEMVIIESIEIQPGS